MKKKLGIIGGMGPLATVELFRMIVELTDSRDDAGHIRTFVDNNTSVPDRTEAILGQGTSPVESIVASAQGLCNLGADILLLPCNTSHYFFEEISSQCQAPLINMISETARMLGEQGIKKVGVLATDGAVRGGVFDKYMSQTVQILYPDVAGQRAVMDFIYNGVKAGNRRYSTLEFENVCDSLAARGAEAIVLGCTEIPVGIRQYGLYERLESHRLIDTLRVLATTAITEAGYRLKS